MEFLAWPTLAWLSAWGVAAPAAPEPVPRRRKRAPGRRKSAKQLAPPNVVRFPLERVRPLVQQAVLREAAPVVPLRSA